MAITIAPEIAGNLVDSTKRYKYVFEPLRIQISESVGGATYTTIDVELRSLTDGSLISSYVEYVFSELNSAGKSIVDLNQVARNFLEGEMYRIGQLSNISHLHTLPGFYMVFKVKTSATTTATSISIVPIIGGRKYRNFTPLVSHTSPLTEWRVEGLSQPDFKGYPKVVVTLKDPSLANVVPTVTLSTPATGREVCGGYLLWKSMYGGWMSYGFDIVSENDNISHKGEIDTGLFDATEVGGNPYIQTNYTSIETSQSISLKALGVPKAEAEALRSLNYAPVVYYMRSEDSPLELMKLSSASVPINNLTNGADVTVSLASISMKSQTLR